MKTFEIHLPLPPGATLVEASAGTGKTWSIARLVARLLAEDPPEGGPPPTIDRILVVTFTDAATAELRDRIRAVLVDAADTLDALRLGVTEERPDDAAYAALARDDAAASDETWTVASHEVLARRAERLRRAIGDFDRATVSTIHGFCQRVLSTLAVESDAPFDSDILRDTRALTEEIVDDWFSRHVVPMEDLAYRWFTDAVKLDRSRLLDVARARVGNHGAAFLPDAGGEDWAAAIDARARTARALWERCHGEEGQAFLATLRDWTERGHMNRSSYKVQTLDDRWHDLCAWLEAGAMTTIPTGADLFHASRIAKGTKHGATFPHALAGALEDLGPFETSPDALLHAFAAFVDREWRARLEHRHALTFDDLLERVANGLHRTEFVDALRRAYRVALIDEFQDTNTVQWSIFRRVFLEDPTARLVLIGDPKQAIYGFRGADVGVYTEACRAVPEARRYTMRRNFRSDRPLIEAMNAVFAANPDALLTDAFRYEAVEADHPPRLYDGHAAVKPFVVRWFDRGRLGIVDTSDAADANKPTTLTVSNGDAAGALAGIVARDIRDDLDRRWTLHEHGEVRPIHAGDIAVLVTTNAEAADLRDALVRAGVPAVITNAGSVLTSEESDWLARWLSALVADRSEASARNVAVTPLFGFRAVDLAQARLASDADASARWMRFKEQLSAQARRLDAHDVTGAFAHLLHDASPPDGRSVLERLAARPAGERHLTNLRHLAELLDTAAHAQRLGAVGLARWLADRRSRPDDSDGVEFRLDADKQTVKVVTMHKSKGLEYPIVYVPGLADGRIFRGWNPGVAPVRFHEDGVLTVDLRGLKAGHGAAARRELMEERQRLMYVALTRAAHRVVLYAGPTSGQSPGAQLPRQDYAQSQLGVLFHRGTPEEADSERIGGMEPDALLDEIRALAPEHVVVEDVTPVPTGDDAVLDGAIPPEESPATFARDGLDLLWRRESYTGIVGHRTGKRTRSDDVEADDDPDEEDDEGTMGEPSDEGRGSVPIQNPPDGVPHDRADVPTLAFHRGADAGKWVHDVFEHVSFPEGVPKKGGTLADVVRAHGERRGFLGDDLDAILVKAFPHMLATPLGAAVGGHRLRDLADHDRLDELKFDMAVGDGDGARVDGAALLHAIGTVRDDDPMPAGYLAHVRSMGTRDLSGFVTGAIDLVFRAEVDGQTRWFVADYKTNTLGARDAEGRFRSTPDHYAQDWMRAEIARKHYYLQYVLYLTALHRYLRLRLGARYDYDRDVGGAVYLFVRGMVGADTRVVHGRPHGVFHDKPPRAVIERVSDLLEGVPACL